MSDPEGAEPRWEGDEDAAVDRFATRMKTKLRANAHKSHWSTVDADYLYQRAIEEMAELAEALRSGDPERIMDEASDVANFVMMIADNEERQ